MPVLETPVVLTNTLSVFAAADALEPARAAWRRLESLVDRLGAELARADVLAREGEEGLAP